MNRGTHIFIGLSLGLLICGQRTSLTALCAIMGSIGGWFPDLDLFFKHRKSLHNIPSLLITGTALYTMTYLLAKSFTTVVPGSIASLTAYSFIAGYSMHIFGDSLTTMGVYVLWPFSNYKLRLAKMKSNGFFINFLGVLLGLAFIALWARDYIYSALILG
ncbi:MAG: metal-dependent hydrolase [Desulfurococcaceae archaeon]|nr:metal-dependent hydrolase [Sulfolobales archaeon]MDW8169573.1 metal-dependent hydrolase [Desulfurococcaceae archaeon]